MSTAHGFDPTSSDPRRRKKCRACYTSEDYINMIHTSLDGGDVDAALAKTSTAMTPPPSLRPPASGSSSSSSSASASASSSASSSSQPSLAAQLHQPFDPSSAASSTTAAPPPHPCPPDSREIGSSTWTLLHSMAAYYPDAPTPQQQRHMTQFMSTFAEFYPCWHCADHLQAYLPRKPVATETRAALSTWMCQMHNDVNKRLHKPTFDCSLKNLDVRWLDGPDDGSCD